MALPLLTTRATFEGLPLVHIAREQTHVDEPAPVPIARCGVDVTGRMPDRLPAAGEQFRFHVDMERCIGCKCCVVACNEQNGNPADVNWRRVTEVEGGVFPKATRAYVSMGCNHCADPTCLAGCPVDAYSKDPRTGIVRHSAETCIGCQYCTWTCSYGVPQFNDERGVVGKCDMCYGRLSAGQAPACVSACPEGALAIEIVNVADWRAAVAASAAGAGLPTADASISTTRVTLPANMPADTRPVDLARLKPDHAHAPLIVMTVLSQLSVGAFAAVWLNQLIGRTDGLVASAAFAFVMCGIALGVAPLHLGRPIHAVRAMKMWRRSWLSREAVLFTAFMHVAGGYVAALWFDWPGTPVLGAAVFAVGLAGVIATARIYFVASRPSWNTSRTMIQFLLTTLALGSLAVAAVDNAPQGLWRMVAVVTAVALVASALSTRSQFARSPMVERQGTARLLSTRFAALFNARLALLAIGGVVVPLLSGDRLLLAPAFAAVLAAELLGRYLFFVTAVPRHLTAPYLVSERSAA